MPHVALDGVRYHYEEAGDGPETVLFAHGLLWSGRMFDAQVAALRDRYRCVTFDWRGQGESEVTKSGYDMETLYADTLALMDALEIGRCHFVGLSMGGFIGMRLAARNPQRVASLVLLETSADPEPRENVPRYRLLALVGRLFGLGVVSGRVMEIMFGQKFLTDPDRAAQREEWRRRLVSGDRAGVARATEGVISRGGVREELGRIEAPTLIVVGDDDRATPPEKARSIHEGIPGSRLVVIPGAGHTATVEEPAAVNAAILGFLEELG